MEVVAAAGQDRDAAHERHVEDVAAAVVGADRLDRRRVRDVEDPQPAGAVQRLVGDVGHLAAHLDVARLRGRRRAQHRRVRRIGDVDDDQRPAVGRLAEVEPVPLERHARGIAAGGKERDERRRARIRDVEDPQPRPPVGDVRPLRGGHDVGEVDHLARDLAGPPQRRQVAPRRRAQAAGGVRDDEDVADRIGGPRLRADRHVADAARARGGGRGDIDGDEAPAIGDERQQPTVQVGGVGALRRGVDRPAQRRCGRGEVEDPEPVVGGEPGGAVHRRDGAAEEPVLHEGLDRRRGVGEVVHLESAGPDADQEVLRGDLVPREARGAHAADLRVPPEQVEDADPVADEPLHAVVQPRLDDAHAGDAREGDRRHDRRCRRRRHVVHGDPVLLVRDVQPAGGDLDVDGSGGLALGREPPRRDLHGRGGIGGVEDVQLAVQVLALDDVGVRALGGDPFDEAGEQRGLAEQRRRGGVGDVPDRQPRPDPDVGAAPGEREVLRVAPRRLAQRRRRRVGTAGRVRHLGVRHAGVLARRSPVAAARGERPDDEYESNGLHGCPPRHLMIESDARGRGGCLKVPETAYSNALRAFDALRRPVPKITARGSARLCLFAQADTMRFATYAPSEGACG